MKIHLLCLCIFHRLCEVRYSLYKHLPLLWAKKSRFPIMTSVLVHFRLHFAQSPTLQLLRGLPDGLIHSYAACRMRGPWASWVYSASRSHVSFLLSRSVVFYHFLLLQLIFFWVGNSIHVVRISEVYKGIEWNSPSALSSIANSQNLFHR